MQDTESIRVGVVGIGHMGQFHVNLLARMKRVELSGLFDIQEERATHTAQRLRIQTFSSYAELLKNVDAVVVATPTHLHFELVKEALEAGCHALVEKPITETVREAEILMNLAEQRRLVLQIGHIERFNAAVQALPYLVKQPLSFDARRIGHGARILDVGVVLDLMIHDIDIVLSLNPCGIQRISSQGARIFSSYEDVAAAAITFENGVLAQFIVSRISHRRERHLWVSDAEAFVDVDYMHPSVTVFDNNGTSSRTLEIPMVNPLEEELLHFVGVILDQRVSLRSPAEELHALEVVEKIIGNLFE